MDQNKPGCFETVVRLTRSRDSRGVSGVRSAKVTALRSADPDWLCLQLPDESARYLADMPDMQDLFPTGMPGAENARQAPVLLPTHVLDHMDSGDRTRLEWVNRHIADVVQVIQTPRYVTSRLEMKRSGHWSLALADEQKGGGRFVVVALSLANREGAESVAHTVITIHPAKRGTFYHRTESGIWVLKGRWQNADKQKTGLK
jgi:hypothetical protein